MIDLCYIEQEHTQIYLASREAVAIISTSEKMNIILSREGKTKKWLADQWGISQPSITQKFKEDNWKESDIKKFCSIMKLNYEIVFTDTNGDAGYFL